MNQFVKWLKDRSKEKSTWIGIGGFIFYGLFYEDVNALVHNVLRSNDLVSYVIQSLGGILCAYLIGKRDNKGDE